MLCFLSFNKLFIQVETGSLISWQLSFFKSLCWGIVLIAFGNQRMSYQPLCTGSLLPSKNSHKFVSSVSKEDTSSIFYTNCYQFSQKKQTWTSLFCGTQVEDAGVCPGILSKIGDLKIFRIFKRLETATSNSPATNFSAFKSGRRIFVGPYLLIFN